MKNFNKIVAIVTIILSLAVPAFSQPVKPHTFSPLDPVSSSKINANFDTIYQWGSVASAAIELHKADTAAHGANGAVVGTTNTQTLTNKTIGTTNSIDGGAIKTGTVADARIDAAIARDSEVTSAVSTHAGLINTHGFYSSNSSSPINPDNTTINGLYYCNSVSLFGQTDGAIIMQVI
ncbi:hypothetical protein MASR1M12_00920 [Erysipelotrichia bacterium]